MNLRHDCIYSWPGNAAGRPLNIAHRGASAHMTENTLRAFRAAADLGADMWEIDVHLTADGQPVVSHDQSLERIFGVSGNIADLSFAQLRQRAPDLPHLDEVIALAAERDQALYVELKAQGAGAASIASLVNAGFSRAALGSFMADEVRRLADASCPYPLSILVPLGADPFERARSAQADIIHLCWERGGDRPQELVTSDLIAEAQRLGLGIVLWHEERYSVLEDLLKLPVLGICTNNPERLAGFDPISALGIELVCHRGINHLAPENTMAAARLAFEQGAAYLELDVRQSADGAVVVIHDPILDRTTSGKGPVSARTLAELKTLDAGSWFSPFFCGEQIPTLEEMIGLAQSYGRKIYIENKSVSPKKLLEIVKRNDFLEHCFFWSADDRLQDGMREIAPDAHIKANLSRYGSVDEMQRQIAPSIAEMDFERFGIEAPMMEGAGIVPMMKYFGDDPAVFDQIVALRPPMLNLDRSDLLLAAARSAA